MTFLPFGLLPGGGVDTYIWMAANVVVLVAIVAQCWRMLGYRITPYLLCISALLGVMCMFLEPVRTTLYFGQINLVLMLLVLWDTARGERSRLKGIGVGIAAGIKLTPAYFILYYLAARQWRAAWWRSPRSRRPSGWAGSSYPTIRGSTGPRRSSFPSGLAPTYGTPRTSRCGARSLA